MESFYFDVQKMFILKGFSDENLQYFNIDS